MVSPSTTAISETEIGSPNATQTIPKKNEKHAIAIIFIKFPSAVFDANQCGTEAQCCVELTCAWWSDIECEDARKSVLSGWGFFMKVVKAGIIVGFLFLIIVPAIAEVRIGSWKLNDEIRLVGDEAEPPGYSLMAGDSKTGFFSIGCKGGRYALGGFCGIDRRADRCVEGRGPLRFLIDGTAKFEVIGSDMFQGDKPTPLSKEQVSSLSQANRSIVLDVFGKSTISLSVFETSKAFAALAAACTASK
jgi:hypothetical protein